MESCYKSHSNSFLILSKPYETGTSLEQMAVNIEFNYLLRQLKVYIQGPLSF